MPNYWYAKLALFVLDGHWFAEQPVEISVVQILINLEPYGILGTNCTTVGVSWHSSSDF